MIYQFSQDFVNQCLKRSRSVDKFEKHNYILEMIITNAKRRHSFIALAYFNSMICVFKIELDKVRNAYKTI